MHLILSAMCMWMYIHIYRKDMTDVFVYIYAHTHVCMYNKIVTVIKAYIIS